jgi:hypothetical protein
MKATQRGAATYAEDGTVTIAIRADGLPAAVGLTPVPFASEAERQQRIAAARDDLHLRGYFIESERRVRNEAFDKRGQKTTTEWRYRVCKNKDEAAAVLAQIARILDAKVGHAA